MTTLHSHSSSRNNKQSGPVSANVSLLCVQLKKNAEHWHFSISQLNHLSMIAALLSVDLHPITHLCVQTCERSIMELQQRVRAEYELTQDTSAQLEALKRIEQV
jgi:hypothetical protein